MIFRDNMQTIAEVMARIGKDLMICMILLIFDFYNWNNGISASSINT